MYTISSGTVIEEHSLMFQCQVDFIAQTIRLVLTWQVSPINFDKKVTKNKYMPPYLFSSDYKYIFKEYRTFSLTTSLTFWLPVYKSYRNLTVTILKCLRSFRDGTSNPTLKLKKDNSYMKWHYCNLLELFSSI